MCSQVGGAHDQAGEAHHSGTDYTEKVRAGRASMRRRVALAYSGEQIKVPINHYKKFGVRRNFFVINVQKISDRNGTSAPRRSMLAFEFAVISW